MYFIPDALFSHASLRVLLRANLPGHSFVFDNNRGELYNMDKPFRAVMTAAGIKRGCGFLGFWFVPAPGTILRVLV
jgi:hypothetical protein